MIRALAGHWPEYLIEGWALGMFMLAASWVVALIEHPSSPVRRLIASALARRALIGLAMGVTAVSLIYSPWGQRSGAHMNPAATLAFTRLGKVPAWDAFFYILAQFAGGTAGMFLARHLLGPVIGHPAVNHVVTVPGRAGVWAAWAAELAIACGMMLVVLFTSNTPGAAAYTGVAAGLLVWLYITFEAPLSGMSMNPARTAASAIPSGIWTHGWIYFTAPLLGMWLGAEIFLAAHGPAPIACPKLRHGPSQRCIFCGQTPAAT